VNRRRTPAIFLLAGLLAMASGCSDSTAELTVRKDGSARIVLRSSAAAAGREHLRKTLPLIEMMGVNTELPRLLLDQGSADAPLDTRELEAWAKEFGPGVRMVSSRRIAGQGRSGFEAVFRADRIRDVRIQGTPASAGGVAFDFVAGDAPILKIIPRAGVESEGGFENSGILFQALDDVVAPLMNGFRLKTTVRVEGRILQAGAERMEGGSSVVLLDLAGSRMNAAGLAELMGVKSVADLARLRRRGLPGIHVANLRTPLVIRFR
jgi:hypothetical protein